MGMTMAAQKLIHAANMAPGSITQSGTAATIMHISVHAITVCISMSPMSVHDTPLRRVSMAQHSVGIACAVWAISWRITAHNGCWERGSVPQAPSQSGGMYVTGDDGEDLDAMTGWAPMRGETSGEGVIEKSRGIAGRTDTRDNQKKGDRQKGRMVVTLLVEHAPFYRPVRDLAFGASRLGVWYLSDSKEEKKVARRVGARIPRSKTTITHTSL